MSSDNPNTRAGDGDGGGQPSIDRAEVLDLVADGMRECHRKVESGRMTDTDRERARQGWHQALAKLANAYRLLERDRSLDELQEQVDALEAEMGDGSGSDNDFQLK